MLSWGMRLVDIDEAARVSGIKKQEVFAAIRMGVLVVEHVFGKPYLDRVDLAVWRLGVLSADQAKLRDGRCPEADVRRVLFLMGDSTIQVGSLRFGRCPIHRIDMSLVLDPLGRMLCHLGCTPGAVLSALEPKPEPVPAPSAGAVHQAPRERRRSRFFRPRR